MKLFILILTLALLSSCATHMNDYEQGCYDGLDAVFNKFNAESKGDEANMIESIKMNTCISLQDNRAEEARRFRREFVGTHERLNQ